MKAHFLVYLALLLCTPAFCLEGPDDGKTLGLVSYLTTVKSTAELKMTALAKEYGKNVESQEAKAVRKQYNNLKLSVDKLISQISADMINRNGMSTYRKINKALKDEKKPLVGRMKPYGDLLKTLNEQYSTFKATPLQGGPIAAVTLEDALGTLELVHTVITDARESREKKVQAIITIMEKLRLDKVMDLTEEKVDK